MKKNFILLLIISILLALSCDKNPVGDGPWEDPYENHDIYIVGYLTGI